jgi:hypothetical protein
MNARLNDSATSYNLATAIARSCQGLVRDRNMSTQSSHHTCLESALHSSQVHLPFTTASYPMGFGPLCVLWQLPHVGC